MIISSLSPLVGPGLDRLEIDHQAYADIVVADLLLTKSFTEMTTCGAFLQILGHSVGRGMEPPLRTAVALDDEGRYLGSARRFEKAEEEEEDEEMHRVG